MTTKIVLWGATGYTGTRVAQALVARGGVPVLAGRDRSRLEALAARLGGPPVAVADVADPASVAALVGRGEVLVSTVGPFAQVGGAAVTAAVDAGAIYLDSTGEPSFVRQVFDVHGLAAERSGAALVTAFGNDYVPGVLAGALALRDARAAGGGEPRRVDVGYFIHGAGRGQGFSRGTLLSLAGAAVEPGYSWRGGTLRAEPAGARMRTFDVGGRPRPGVTIGAVEQYALPRLEPGLRVVDVYLGWFGPLSGAVHAASAVTPWLQRVPSLGRAPLSGAKDTRAQRGRSSWVSGLAGLAAGRVAEEPDAATLARTTSEFVAEVFDASGTLLARTRLTAPDAYAITAELLAWGALRAAEHGVDGVGALDPVQAFGLDPLTDGAATAGVRPAAD